MNFEVVREERKVVDCFVWYDTICYLAKKRDHLVVLVHIGEIASRKHDQNIPPVFRLAQQAVG